MEADSNGVQACIHYWLLGPAALIVHGICKRCGTERNFNGDMWDAPVEGGAMRQIIHDGAVQAKALIARRKSVDASDNV